MSKLIKLTDNIGIQELVPPKVFAKWGKHSIRYINRLLPGAAQGIRDHFGRSLTINDWQWGGRRKYSGLRTQASKHYLEGSDHTLGNAIDFIVKGLNSLEVQQEILANEQKFARLGITAIEKDTIGWTHVSVAWRWNVGIDIING